MKNASQWRPSKYRVADGRLSASTDPAELGGGSFLIAAVTAHFYERYLVRYCHGHLLDLGCGKAPMYGFYKDRATQVTTVDWGGSYHGGAHVDYEVDLNGPIPLDTAQFDVIILSDVLEHLIRPQTLWAEMARLLKPDGVLLLSVPFMYWLHEEPHDYHRYTEHALRYEAAEAGLSVAELVPMGGMAEVMADMAGKALGTVPLVGPALARWIQSVAFGRVVRKGVAANTKWPLGYFLVARKPAENAEPR